MPTYEFSCAKCGHSFDEFFWPEEETSKLKCPKCGNDALQKIMLDFSKSCGTNPRMPTSFG